MKENILIAIIAIFTVLLTVPATSLAVSPQQLQEMLARGEEVTMIDIRVQHLYTEGHIPGAISIPSALIARKRLPPLGAVIVYGDGIRTDLTVEAVNALNNKSGIQADILEGGFPAWEALGLLTTHQSGFKKESIPYISYEELEKVVATNPDMVLVDLRGITAKANAGSSENTANRGARGQKEADDKLTDLSVKFPGLDVIQPTRRPRQAGKDSNGKEWDLSAITRGGGKETHHRWLYVLIDQGDGEAGKVAHRLKAAGIKRMVILTGGELILNRGGQPGQERIRH